MELQWTPHFAELIDRLSIHQLKEVLIPEQKEKYAREMKLIENDLDEHINSCKIPLSATMIRAIIALSQVNTHIWYNESAVRNGKEQDLEKLKLTHGLNGLRVEIQTHILSMIMQQDRIDFKSDCLAADFKDWRMSL